MPDELPLLNELLLESEEIIERISPSTWRWSSSKDLLTYVMVIPNRLGHMVFIKLFREQSSHGDLGRK